MHLSSKTRILQTTASFLLLLTTPLIAIANSGESALRLCAMLDASNLLSKPCEVAGWGGTVNMTVDMSASEARKTCAAVVNIVQKQGLKFDRRWKLNIYSPYSGESTIAFCRLN